MRLGRDRISFLVGNYRLAAVKKRGGVLRLEMAFAEKLPDCFQETSFRWRSVDGVVEGFLTVENMPLPLDPAAVKSFITACERLRDAALKTKLWECNVSPNWPEDKSHPCAGERQ